MPCRRFLYFGSDILITKGLNCFVSRGKRFVNEDRDLERCKYFYKKESRLERSQIQTAMRVNCDAG
jgi:hypothetical protein